MHLTMQVAGSGGATDCSITEHSCVEMIPICADESLSYPATTGVGLAEPGNNYGPLATTANPAWFFFVIDDPGRMVMELSARRDVDYAMWGPFPDEATAISYCGSLPPPIDASYSPSAIEHPTVRASNPGDVFIIMTTNHADLPQEMHLEHG
jgi:hypothetical protein